jgi:hypothetical protein
MQSHAMRLDSGEQRRICSNSPMSPNCATASSSNYASPLQLAAHHQALQAPQTAAAAAAV